jgi:tetratricopeptide (TPR) repeat protein
MATPYFFGRQCSGGSSTCNSTQLKRVAEMRTFVKLIMQARSQAKMGGALRGVLFFLSLALCGLLYFYRRFVILEISHKGKDKNLSGQLSAVSTNSIPGPAFARHRALRKVAFYLLFAAFGAITTTTAWAAQTQSNVEALLEQARGEEISGDYAAAERIYKQVLALAPESLETLKRLGVLEQTELKFDDSIQLFKQVLANDPRYPGVNFFLGVSYFGKNDFNQSIDSFDRELKTPNPHPRAHYYLGLALQSSGRLEEALSQLNQSLAQNPKDADALYELARIYKNASLRSIELLKALDEDSFQLHALMGEVYAEEERYPEAIEEYQAALAKRPDAQGMHYAIGIAYWAQRRMDLAEKEFKDAWKENPNDALTNLYLGDIAVRDQRFSEALRFLLVAQRGQPNMSQVHVLLGKCYLGQKEPEKAKDEFLAAINADPAAAQPHYLLANVYHELHDQEARAAELAQFERLSKQEKEKTRQHNPQN